MEQELHVEAARLRAAQAARSIDEEYMDHDMQGSNAPPPSPPSPDRMRFAAPWEHLALGAPPPSREHSPNASRRSSKASDEVEGGHRRPFTEVSEPPEPLPPPPELFSHRLFKPVDEPFDLPTAPTSSPTLDPTDDELPPSIAEEQSPSQDAAEVSAGHTNASPLTALPLLFVILELAAAAPGVVLPVAVFPAIFIVHLVARAMQMLPRSPRDWQLEPTLLAFLALEVVYLFRPRPDARAAAAPFVVPSMVCAVMLVSPARIAQLISHGVSVLRGLRWLKWSSLLAALLPSRLQPSWLLPDTMGVQQLFRRSEAKPARVREAPLLRFSPDSYVVASMHILSFAALLLEATHAALGLDDCTVPHAARCHSPWYALAQLCGATEGLVLPAECVALNLSGGRSRFGQRAHLSSRAAGPLLCESSFARNLSAVLWSVLGIVGVAQILVDFCTGTWQAEKNRSLDRRPAIELWLLSSRSVAFNVASNVALGYYVTQLLELTCLSLVAEPRRALRLLVWIQLLLARITML